MTTLAFFGRPLSSISTHPSSAPVLTYSEIFCERPRTCGQTGAQMSARSSGARARARCELTLVEKPRPTAIAQAMVDFPVPLGPSTTAECGRNAVSRECRCGFQRDAPTVKSRARGELDGVVRQKVLEFDADDRA